jgi:single-strand DNA-binding protein
MNELLIQLLRASQHRFIGRLGFEPEMRYFETGLVVCNARLLINQPGSKRDDGKQPDSFKLVLWNERAQAFADACSKGDLVEVSGQVKSETWTDRTTGEERSAWSVQVEKWEILMKKRGDAPAQQQSSTRSPAPAPAAKAEPDWTSSDALPF